MMLDQRLLPNQEVWLELRTWQEVAEAIRDMAVRGAPAIGVAAAYGMALSPLSRPEGRGGQGGGGLREEAARGLAASRPTAVNLFWAIERMLKVEPWNAGTALAEAQKIEAEDLAMNLKIGEHGAALVRKLHPDPSPPAPSPRHSSGRGGPGSPNNQQPINILTICNTGGLATSGHGTALGVIRTAFAQGKNIHVYSCETRPRMQGLRLTAWELMRDGIPFHSIADGVAGSLMRAGKVDLVIAGADRIAANGDAANKIGTYSLAVLARHHGIPFYVAAPSSTFDPSLASGDLIQIEERDAEELTHIDGHSVAPDSCPAYNPAFDVTPVELIDAIVSERGVHRAPLTL